MKIDLINKFKQLLKSRYLLIGLIALVLLFGQVVSPKEQAKGNVTTDQTAGVWSGTLGPAAPGTGSSDIDILSGMLVTNNTTLGQYEAGFNGPLTVGSVRSAVISPTLGSFVKWNQLKLGLRRPPGTTTAVTVDILCGDSGNSQCTLNQPLLLNVPLSASDEYNIPASLTQTRIKIKVNFTRPDTINPITVLYNWQVSWEVSSGVSVTVSKTPNPANPESYQGPYPGVPNNYQVQYTLSLTLNRNVSNLTLELPLPSGTYSPVSGTPKTYTSNFVGASFPGSLETGNKIVWRLNNVTAGTGIVQTAIVKIENGPPNGTVFKTKAKVYGSDYSPVTLPDDLLNIQSKGVLSSILIGPEYVAGGYDTNYILKMAWTGNHQSDLFNGRYEFWYDPCMNEGLPVPVITGTGAVSVTQNTTNFNYGGVAYGGKFVFTMPQVLQVPLPHLMYVVKMRALGTSFCSNGTIIDGALVFDSDQNESFVAQKTSFLSSGYGSPTFDTTPSVELDYGKDGPPALVGGGQLLGYNIRLENRSTVPVNDFYLLDKVPTNTTFVHANVAFGELAKLGSLANNWKIYYSTYTGAGVPPRGNHTGGWVELTYGGSPGQYLCPSGCSASPPPAGKITWVKWDLSGNQLQWDRLGNFDPMMAQMAVVSDTSSSGVITNEVRAYSGLTCWTRSPNTTCPETYTVNINNQPHFATDYVPCNSKYTDAWYGDCYNNPTVVAAGESYYIASSVWNSWDWNGETRGDASNVKVTVRLPDLKYLDQTTPIDLAADSPYARCWFPPNNWRKDCDNNPGDDSWIYPTAIKCSSALGPTCTVEWTLPVMYSRHKYPETYPEQYGFYFKLKTRTGLLNNQTICNGNCTINVTSNPSPNNTNLPAASPYEVKIAASPQLTISKTKPITGDIGYQETALFRITYSNLAPSTGAVSSVTIIDALPENVDYTPTQRMNLDPANMPVGPPGIPAGNVSIKFMVTNPSYTRNSTNPPPTTDPNWKTAAQISGQENLVDWVMWVINDQVDLGESNYVDLSLKDSGSPDSTVFTNRAFLTFPGANTASLPEANATVSIYNPGFTNTNLGDVGSIGKLGSRFLPPEAICTPGTETQANCNTRYLGISGAADYNLNSTPLKFKSFKNWLVSEYQFSAEEGGLVTDYNQMWQDYGKQAKPCGQSNCFDDDNTDRVRIFNGSPGNPLKVSQDPYYLGVPMILFVNNRGNLALEIDNFFSTKSDDKESGVIFVVNGDVQVHPSVETIEGLFLVDGKFSTGRRAQTVAAPNAGRYAAVSVSSWDGFSRIAYVAGNSIRFIRCLDISCVNRNYEVIGSSGNIQSLNMSLFYDISSKALPRIIVGRREGDNASTNLIVCGDENCTNTSSYTFDGSDPDIATTGYGTVISVGLEKTSPRSVGLITCISTDCSSRSTESIDGGEVVDKGNETNVGFNSVNSNWEVTYVDRSAGKSDLWLARKVNPGTGTGCSNSSNFTCTRISPSPGNIGAFQSTNWVTDGRQSTVYRDSATNQIRNILCSDAVCSSTDQLNIDCNSGCQGQNFVSNATASAVMFSLYNIRTDLGNGNFRDEVKLGSCFTGLSCTDFQWTKYPISNSADFVSNKSYSYTQSLDVGKVTEAGMPRIVFYNGDNNELIYLRCTTADCSSGNYFSVLDSGAAPALKDKQLNLYGSVIAYGVYLSVGQAINLERDLFYESKQRPAEVFTLEPKYYYLFREVIKEPQQFFEKPP